MAPFAHDKTCTVKTLLHCRLNLHSPPTLSSLRRCLKGHVLPVYQKNDIPPLWCCSEARSNWFRKRDQKTTTDRHLKPTHESHTHAQKGSWRLSHPSISVSAA